MGSVSSLGVAAFAAAHVVLPKDEAQHAGLSRPDLPGGVTLVSGLGALVLGIQGASEHGWTSVRTLVLLATAATLLTVFGTIERRVSSPLVPPHTWKVKTLVAGTSVMLGTIGILVGVIFLTSLFVQTVLGDTALQTGLAFLPLALVMAAAAHAASQVATKVCGVGKNGDRRGRPSHFRSIEVNERDQDQAQALRRERPEGHRDHAAVRCRRPPG